MATYVEHEEVTQFIKNYSLMGNGLKYIDVHLLASAMLTRFHSGHSMRNSKGLLQN